MVCVYVYMCCKPIVVVGFFDKSHAKSQLHSSFLLVSARMRDDTYFAVVNDASVAASVGVDLSTDKEGAVVAFKAYDDKRTTYVGSTATAKLQEWIQSNSLPLVVCVCVCVCVCVLEMTLQLTAKVNANADLLCCGVM